MDSSFLTPEQAARMLNLSTYTIRAYARQGLIPAHKVGRMWRFSQVELVKWIETGGKEMGETMPAVAKDAATKQAGAATRWSNQCLEALEVFRNIRSRSCNGDIASLVEDAREELLERERRRLDRK